MGKKEIPIELIHDLTKRRTTFGKRHLGVQKKAYEISKLCNVNTLLIYFDEKDEVYSYCNMDINDFLTKYNSVPENVRQIRHQYSQQELKEFIQKNEETKNCKKERNQDQGQSSHGVNNVANNFMDNNAIVRGNDFQNVPNMAQGSPFQNQVPHEQMSFYHDNSQTRMPHQQYGVPQPQQRPQMHTTLPMGNHMPSASFPMHQNHASNLRAPTQQQHEDTQLNQNQGSNINGLQDGSYGFHTGSPHMQNGSYDNNIFQQDAMQINNDNDITQDQSMTSNFQMRATESQKIWIATWSISVGKEEGLKEEELSENRRS